MQTRLMGRTSLKSKRKLEIVEAFEQCVIDYGLEATTIEMVAEKAGVRRDAVYHNVGNREKLIQTSIDYLIEKCIGHLSQDFLEAAPKHDRIELFLSELFGGGFMQNHQNDWTVIEELTHAAARNDATKIQVRKMYEAYAEEISESIGKVLGIQLDDKVRETAYVIMCLAEENAAMQDLGLPKSRSETAKAVARNLINQLGHRS
ncbi:MAG: TetR/AcrR family transcriptional regulator [Pseudomonadota bacterium]